MQLYGLPMTLPALPGMSNGTVVNNMGNNNVGGDDSAGVPVLRATPVVDSVTATGVQGERGWGTVML